MSIDGWLRLLTWDHIMFLLRGLRVTLELLFIIGALSIPLGCLLAIGRYFSKGFWRLVLDIYVNVFRNFPVLVIILFIRFGLPQMGVPIRSAMFAGIMAFTLYCTAIIAEILRGAIDSVSRGQLEAALATGCSKWFAFTRILLPQAVRYSYPGIAGQMIILLQNTALVTMIGVPDLLNNATVIYSRQLNPLETLTLIGMVYFLLCTLLAYIRNVIERRSYI